MYFQIQVENIPILNSYLHWEIYNLEKIIFSYSVIQYIKHNTERI